MPLRDALAALPSRLLPGVAVLLFGGLCGCVTDVEIFTQGRLQNPCSSAIPICRARAQCVLRTDEYVSGRFPGGFRTVFHSEFDEGTLAIRLLLTEMLAPGSELHVQVHGSDCGSIEQAHLRDVDLFEYAGKDRTIELQFPIKGRGDHLIEIFSDMSADYLLALTLDR
jgi:hypothetical protein